VRTVPKSRTDQFGKLEGIMPTDNISVSVLNKSCLVLTARGKFSEDSNRTAKHHILPLIL
jgi:hypothetical protein